MEATTIALARVLLEQAGEPSAKTMTDDEVRQAVARMRPDAPAQSAAAAPPAGEVWVDPMTLEGDQLDFWTARALGLPAERRPGGELWIMEGGKETARCQPSTNMHQAGLILRNCKIELKPPLNAGEPWEAWFDRMRAMGQRGNGTPPAVGAGPEWQVAVCRSAVIARFGDRFDANNPLPTEEGRGMQTGIGQPRAIIGPAPGDSGAAT